MQEKCGRCDEIKEGQIGKFSYFLECSDKVFSGENFYGSSSSYTHEKHFVIYNDTINLGEIEKFICNSCMKSKKRWKLASIMFKIFLISVPLIAIVGTLLLVLFSSIFIPSDGLVSNPDILGNIIGVFFILVLTFILFILLRKLIIKLIELKNKTGNIYFRILDKMALKLHTERYLNSQKFRIKLNVIKKKKAGNYLGDADEKKRQLKFLDRYGRKLRTQNVPWYSTNS